MPQPPTYTRQANFTAEQAANPTGKTPGVSLDAEFNALKATVDQVNTNLAVIQRDDGQLANASVGLVNLKPELVIGINNPLPWVTARAYALNDVVWQNNILYLCIVAHTSGVFATDLAAARWVSFLDYSNPLASAQAAATAAAASQTAAATSASQAATSATNAGASATAAAASAASAASVANAFGIPVVVASGGTGATTASAARSNLGVQPSAANKLLYGASATALAETDLTVFGRSLIDDNDAAAARTTLGATTTGAALFTAAAPLDARNALGINLTDNRIINGRIEIDQANAGAAVTVNAATTFYSVDMFGGFGQAADGVFTLQRQAGGPAGFKNFLRAAVTTADASLGAAQAYFIRHLIEGGLVSDLAFGGSSASTVTLRFWVRSSVAGTFSGALRNAAADRSYPFSYSINAANTWELKSITVAGDQTGTWLTDTGVGLQVVFDLGAGSTLRGAAGAWAASNLTGVTGAVSLMSTLNATLDITGVELVRASSDLGPSWRPEAQELMLCQRYLYRIGGAATFDWLGLGFVAATNQVDLHVAFPVRMRVVPTLTVGSATGFQVNDGTVTPSCTAVALSGAVSNTADAALVVLTGLSGLTIGRVARVYANGTTNGWMLFSARL